MKDVESEIKEAPKENRVASSVLDAFDLLKAPKDESKITGGAKIISILQSNEALKNNKDRQYALKRLVRSLGANVPEMRTGYFATLVTVLKKFDISVSELLALIKKELHASGSSKSEVGDVSLGQILVCGAIFRSGLIMKASLQEQNETVRTIFAASGKKSYLNIVAYLLVLDFINNLDEEQFSTMIWTIIKKDFKKALNEHSLDSLYFLLMLNKKFPNKVKLKKILGVDDLLCEDTIHTICEKLMGSIDFNTLDHPIYNEIGILIANSPHLHLFWTSGIDSQLTKHNRNRELVALNLIIIILNNMEDNFEIIPELLSKNFFKLFMDWFRGLQTASKIRNKRDDEDDHKLMIKKEREFLSILARKMKSDRISSKVKVETLKRLLFYPGEMNFTEVTGTNTVKSIMSDLDKDGVKKLAKLFKGVLLNNSKKLIKENIERNWYNNERLKAAEALSYLVCHEVVKDDTDFKLTYMKLLMCFGFFKIGGNENVTISCELSGGIKSSFYRCFSSKFSNVDNLLEVLSELCNFINSNLANEKIKEKLEKQFPAENVECWEMLMQVCQTVGKNENKTKVEKVFMILLWQLGLFLFSEPKNVEMARSSIKELKSCFEHYEKGEKKKPKVIKREGELVDDEPEWIEVLVEVLLSILSTDSSVLRSAVQCVFRLLWEYLTPTALGQIISVLDPESESNPLTRNDEESENSDVSDEEEDDKNSEDDKNEIESESETDIDDDDDGDMKTPEQLRMAIQKALGSAALDSDADSVDADMIDEEEGKKLDEALSEAFKLFHQPRNKRSKKDRKDKKTLSDFRVRVLDLIDIYLEKDPSMDICLGMMGPLIRCIEFSIQDNQFKELENRCRKTIKLLTKIRKFSSTENVDIGILCDYVKSIIEKGSRSSFMFQALGDVITHCASFIIHCALKVDTQHKSPKKKSVYTPLIEMFKEALQSFFQNRNCLLPIIFFHGILQIEWEGNYELIPIVIENAFSNSVRQFRKNEALELLAGFYRSLKRLKPGSGIVQTQLSNVEKLLEKTLNEAINNDSEQFAAKNNFFVTLKKLINTIRSVHESCHIDSTLDYKLLLNSISTNKNNCIKANKTNTIQQQNAQSKKDNNKKRKNNKKNKRKIGKINGDHKDDLPPQKKIRVESLD